ncbi:MAG: hypothetical protein IH998_11935 [Proteobacteria bacterium]|nr:hypothetical protein [Pseudomonadota bacterium]
MIKLCHAFSPERVKGARQHLGNVVTETGRAFGEHLKELFRTTGFSLSPGDPRTLPWSRKAGAFDHL